MGAVNIPGCGGKWLPRGPAAEAPLVGKPGGGVGRWCDTGGVLPKGGPLVVAPT